MADRQGMNQESIQASNRTLILHLLRENQNCSRAYLAKRSDLKQATVTNIVNDFIDRGLVVETGLLNGSKGRRSISISIADKPWAVLGIRLSRQNYSIGVFNLMGEAVSEYEKSISSEDKPQNVIHAIIADAKDTLKKHSDRKFLACGMAVPGPLNTDFGKILYMTEAEGWNAFNVRETFERELGLAVIVQHDARAGAWAQLWHNKKVDSHGVLVYVSVGQGVGSGVLINGKSFEGGQGITGEIGHMTIDYRGEKCECGNRGCLERYTSSISFVRNYNRSTGKNLSFEEISRLVKDADATAVREYEQCCRYLGTGIVNIINCLTPTYVVLGDEMVKVAPDIAEREIKKVVGECTFPEIRENLKVFPDDMGINAELYGAAVAAIREVFDNYAQIFPTAD